MTKNTKISDEMLNAYIDGELSPTDLAEMASLLKNDKDLAAKVCQLRLQKEMLKLSYAQLPTTQASSSKQLPTSSNFSRVKHLSGLAASIVLVLAIGLGGVLGFQYAQFNGSQSQPMAQLQPIPQNRQHVLLHIGTDDSKRIALALDNAENLLNSFKQRGLGAEVQILVNAEGIHMLNAEGSPFIERIQSMSHRFDNLSFLACQRAIERQKLKGVDIHLVKQASVIPEALQAIVNRLENNWVYIRA